MSGDYQIPFDREGNQQHYPEVWYVGVYPNHKADGPHWRENEPFDDKLTYVGYRRGRSAAYFAFRRTNGNTVTMFLKDFEAVVPLMQCGQIDARFRFVKRGQNYGVQLMRATDSDTRSQPPENAEAK